jgi:hypothetical protein
MDYVDYLYVHANEELFASIEANKKCLTGHEDESAVDRTVLSVIPVVNLNAGSASYSR